MAGRHELRGTELLHAELADARRRITQLEAVLRAVLKTFCLSGHPGFEALRTGWVRRTVVEQWRAVAGKDPRHG